MSEAVVDGIQAEGEEEPEMGIRIVDLVAKEWAEDEIIGYPEWDWVCFEGVWAKPWIC